MIDPIFTSSEAFEQAFNQGLSSMLEADELGAFILLLANASNDDRLWSQLQPKLKTKLAQLNEHQAQGAPDDVAVFEQLLEMDLDTLSTTQTKQLGAFELQYNPLRALRPKRMSEVSTQGVFQAFDPQGFNFNKAFLQKELFFKGTVFGKDVSLFYNKFPFAKLHGLVVVEADKEHPQRLTYELHQFAWMMANALGLSIPGFTLAYNAYGAYASVNHFHLQCFVRTEPLPIELDEKYPLVHYWFGSISDAWQFIEALHTDQQPYHLIYRDHKVLVVVRQRQDNYTHADWTSGYAWYEACGGVCVSSQADFETLSESALSAELAKLKIE